MESAGKRQKREHVDPMALVEEEKAAKTVIIQFKDADDNEVGFEISVGTDINKGDLNNLLSEVRVPEDKDEPNQRYQFYLDDKEIKTSIQDILDRIQNSQMKDAQAKKA